jgi:hypothetical protein
MPVGIRISMACKFARNHMRVFKIIYFNIPRRETPSETIARYASFLDKNLKNPPDIRFYFGDSAHNKISHIDRVIKNYPILAPFIYLDDLMVVHGFKHNVALSNFDKYWEGFDNTPRGAFDDIKSIYEILSGIPRRFAIHEAIVIYNDVNFFESEVVVDSQPGNYPTQRKPHSVQNLLSQSIVHRDSWGNSGRYGSLSATIELLEGNTLPDYTVKILDTICSSYSVDTLISPSRSEIQEIDNMYDKVNALTESYFKSFVTRTREIVGPYDINDIFCVHNGSDHISLKDGLKATFAKDGFKIEKAVYVTVIPAFKLTPKNNRICATFIMNKMYGTFEIRFAFQGMYRKSRDISFLFFPLSELKIHGIANQETMNFILSAALKCWHVAERELVPKVDDLFGPSPEWLFNDRPRKSKKK